MARRTSSHVILEAAFAGFKKNHMVSRPLFKEKHREDNSLSYYWTTVNCLKIWWLKKTHLKAIYSANTYVELMTCRDWWTCSTGMYISASTGGPADGEMRVLFQLQWLPASSGTCGSCSLSLGTLSPPLWRSSHCCFEHVTSSREEGWGCNLVDVPLSFFHLCAMFILKCHQNHLFCHMSLCNLIHNKWERERERERRRGREEDRKRKPIPILKSIYFSKTIHILFMPQVYTYL